ncbi:hypothetical protein VPHD51_0087 [Vibrio phage D51]
MCRPISCLVAESGIEPISLGYEPKNSTSRD